MSVGATFDISLPEKLEGLPHIQSAELYDFQNEEVPYIKVNLKSVTPEDRKVIESILKSVIINYVVLTEVDSYDEITVSVEYSAENNCFEIILNSSSQTQPEMIS